MGQFGGIAIELLARGRCFGGGVAAFNSMLASRWGMSFAGEGRFVVEGGSKQFF